MKNKIKPHNLDSCPTASQLIDIAKGHKFRECQGCGIDCSSVAMVDLVYTFEPCDCAAASFTHLVETLYHRGCFLIVNVYTRTTIERDE